MKKTLNMLLINALVCLSAIGQESTDSISATTNDSINLFLHEIEVVAPKAVVSRDGHNFSISNLSGTHIGEAGTLYDMLGWTPGIMVNGVDDIKVGGSANVGTIYIDEQKVTDRNILMSIPSSQVAKIEVIRDLGVRYSAETGAVINITLKKQLKDHLGVSVSNDLSFRHRLSNKGMVNFSGKYDNISFICSLVELCANNKSYDYGGTTIFKADDKEVYSDNFDTEYSSFVTRHLWNVGLNYLAKPKLNFILQYSGNSSNTDSKEHKHHQLSMADVESSLNEDRTIPHRKSSSHNLTSGMTYTSPTGHFVNLTISYSHQNKGETQCIDILNTTKSQLTQKNIVSSSKYDLLDAEANWRFSHQGNNWGFGYNLSMIKNSYNFINDGIGQATIRKDYTNVSSMKFN